MATQEQIAAALDDIPAGTEVRIRLADGSERVGPIDGLTDGEVLLQDADQPIEPGEVVEILTDHVIGGDPE